MTSQTPVRTPIKAIGISTNDVVRLLALSSPKYAYGMSFIPFRAAKKTTLLAMYSSFGNVLGRRCMVAGGPPAWAIVLANPESIDSA